MVEFIHTLTTQPVLSKTSVVKATAKLFNLGSEVLPTGPNGPGSLFAAEGHENAGNLFEMNGGHFSKVLFFNGSRGHIDAWALHPFILEEATVCYSNGILDLHITKPDWPFFLKYSGGFLATELLVKTASVTVGRAACGAHSRLAGQIPPLLLHSIISSKTVVVWGTMSSYWWVLSLTKAQPKPLRSKKKSLDVFGSDFVCL